MAGRFQIGHWYCASGTGRRFLANLAGRKSFTGRNNRGWEQFFPELRLTAQRGVADQVLVADFAKPGLHQTQRIYQLARQAGVWITCHRVEREERRVFIDWLPRVLRPFTRNRNWIERRKAQNPSQGPAMAQAERLEERTLLSFTWEPAGPNPILNGQVEGTAANTSPVIGAVTTVLPHPSNSDIMWIGTANGGIWQTTNATAVSPTWLPLTDQLGSLSISSLELDPTDLTNNTLVAGVSRLSDFSDPVASGGVQNSAGGAYVGLYRSTDGGTTWSNINGAGILTNKSITGTVSRGLNIVVGVNDLSGLPLAQQGIYRSTNGGASFNLVSGGNGLPIGTILDITADPITSGTIYATVNTGTVGTGIYRSVDTGATWTLLNDAAINATVANPASINHLRVSVGRNNNVFLGVLNAGQLTGLFRSGDGGTTWTALDLPVASGAGLFSTPLAGQPGYLHFSLTADPVNANIVYVGGDAQPGPFPNTLLAQQATGRLFRVNAGLAAGAQVTALTHNASTVSRSAPHNDTRDIVFDAAGNLIQSDDGGVYRRTNPRTTGDWFSMNGNLQITEFHDIAYDSLSNRVLGGSQDNGILVQVAGGTNYTQVLAGDTGDVAVDDVTLAGQGLSVHYIGNQSLANFRRATYNNNGILQFTTPIGLLVSGAPLATVDTTIQQVTPFVLNAVIPTRGVLGTNAIYESFNQFDSLIDVSGPTGSPIAAMAYGGYLNGVANPDVLWYATGNDIYLRPTSASTPQIRSAYFGNDVVDLVIDAHDWQQAYVIDSGAVYFTANAGLNWSNITGTLNAIAGGELKSLEFVDLPGDNDAIVIGTNSGAFYARTDTPSTWTELGVGLPNVPVYDIDYDAADDLLVLGTLGRGAWVMRNASITFDPPTPEGVISFSQDNYRMGDSVIVNLSDLDLAGTTTLQLIITADSGDQEFITLNEITGTGVFVGSLVTASSEVNGFTMNNGVLQVDRGATVTVTYTDQNNGNNQTVTVADTAQVFELSNFFEFDFSDDAGAPSLDGFTLSGSTSQWHLSQGLGNLPGHSADDSMYFGSNEGPLGGGSYSNNSSGTLTSPLIDLGVIRNSPIFLEFNSFLDIQDGADNAVVSIINGNTVVPIASNNGISNLPDSTGGAWQHYAFDITAFAGQQIRVQFQFTSDGSVTGEGWYVDDLVVRAPAAEIHGTKWNDLDGDGLQDLDEPGLPGWTIFTDFNNNGILDESTTSASNNTQVAIPDAGAVTSTITLGGINAPIRDLNLTLNVLHNRTSDLQVRLTSPEGTTITLVSAIGGNTGQNFIATTFDDEAAGGIQFGSAPFLGAYIPQQLLSAFDGEEANGDWTLTIQDLSATNTGTLLSWSLTTTVMEVSTVTDSNGNYILSGLQAGTYTVAEVPQTGWDQTFPAAPGTHTVVLGTGRLSSGLDFGNWFVNPVLTLPSGGALYAENDPPVIVDPRATVVDTNSPFYTNGSLTVTITQNGSFDDVLGIKNFGTGAFQIGASNGVLTYQNVQIGVYSGGTLLQPLAITFNANASLAAVQATVRAITFEVLGDNPTGATRTLEFVLVDNTGGVSSPVTTPVEVLPINDPPIVTVGPQLMTYTENGGVVNIDPTATVTDPDSPDFNGGSVTATLLGNDTGLETSTTSTFVSLDVPKSTVGGTLPTTVAAHDFESGTGFSSNEGYTSSGSLNQWHLTSSLGGLAGHTSSNSFYFGVNESTDQAGQTVSNASGTLFSPNIDLRSVIGPIVLTFNYWMDNPTVINRFVDSMEVGITGSLTGIRQIIANNTGAQNLGGPISDTGGRWVSYSVDLSQFAGQVVSLDFAFQKLISTRTIRDPGSGVIFLVPISEGWYVDDIQITGDTPLPNTSTLSVVNQIGTITDVNVKFSITHPDVRELSAYLISPTGTRIKLFSNVGTQFFGGASSNFFNTTLDDQAAFPLLSQAATAPFTGSFKPEKELAQLIGENPNGQWKLEVYDGTSVLGDNSGTIDSWELEITTSEISTNERLKILHQGFGPGEIGLVGNRVTYGGTVFGTFDGGIGTFPLVVNLSTNSTQAAVQSLIQNLALEITGDDPLGGSRQVEIVVDDGDGGVSDPAIKNVLVVPVNDPPVLDIPGGTIAFVEGSVAISLDLFTTITDPDSHNFDTAQLGVGIIIGGSANDRLAIRSSGTGAGQVNISGNNVRVGTTVVGTWSGGIGSNIPLVITFNTNATAALVQLVARNITFQVLGSNPSTSSRIINALLTDGDGGTSAIEAKTVTITLINDPPVLTLPGPTPVNYLANGGPVVIDPFATFSDADNQVLTNARLTVQLVGGVSARDRITLLSQNGVVVNGSSVFFGNVLVGRYVQGVAGAAMTVDFNSSASVNAMQAVLRNVAFQILGPSPTGGTRTVKFVATDGTNGLNSTSATLFRDITVQINNLPPVNEVPVLPYTTTEDTPKALTGLSMSDPDAGLLPMSVTLSVLNGTLNVSSSVIGGLVSGEISGNGTAQVTLTGDQLAINTTLAGLNAVMYTPRLDYFGQDRVIMTTNDLGNTGPGGNLSDTDNVFINVTDLDDPARLTTSTGTTVHRKASTGTMVDTSIRFTEGDGVTTYTGARVEINVVSGRNRSDALRLLNQGKGTDQVYISGSTIKINNITIGKFSGGSSGKALVITFNANASAADIQRVLRRVNFRTATQTTVFGMRSIEYKYYDDTAVLTSTAYKDLNVTT